MVLSVSSEQEIVEARSIFSNAQKKEPERQKGSGAEKETKKQEPEMKKEKPAVTTQKISNKLCTV